MPTSLKIRPPFAWLGRYAGTASLLGVIAIAAFFRFYQLDALPPGLYEGSAQIGLQAAALADHGTLPTLSAANGYAPLWIWLQAGSIKLLGHTQLALLIWPALLGTLAILTTWLWAKAWFGIRVAWLTSFLLAVTPWAVTLSRNGVVAAMLPLLATFTLWTATLAWKGESRTRYLPLAGALALDLLSGPVGWLLAATTLVAGIVVLYQQKKLLAFDSARQLGVGVIVLALAGFGYLAATSLKALTELPAAVGLTKTVGTLGTNLVKTLLMFNVAGDENYRHNLAGEPLLNAFVGLMLIAGLLVGISRLHERRYRLLFAFAVILLIPAAASSVGVPNAARASGLLPLVLALAAIGISYMLELWYRTFPINSAARATGQAAIIVLLGLTLFQGYTQYFRAWAGSSEVYAAYNEGAVEAAKRELLPAKFNGERFFVAPVDEQPVAAYLVTRPGSYRAIEASGIAGLPVAASSRQFVIVAASRDAAVKNLRLKFPGGVLRPHYSRFNLAEIYYTYEVNK